MIAQWDWGVLVLGDIPKLSVHIDVPGQQALGGPAWAAQLDQMTFRTPSTQVSSNLNHLPVKLWVKSHSFIKTLPMAIWSTLHENSREKKNFSSLLLLHCCCRPSTLAVDQWDQLQKEQTLAGELLLCATSSEGTISVHFNHLRTNLWIIQVTD